jgi:predicted glycoside hydrolase/deacetylase ChbG (UPF0249 family)
MAEASGPPRVRRALVVTADDFGFGRATSAGIVQAHREGPVTATSMMTVTGDHVRASVPLLATAPELEVGLHLVLTDVGAPALVAREGSGLVGADGRFRKNPEFWRRALAGRVDREAVLAEIVAQAELFRRLVGRPPAFIDGHHHAHQLPVVRRALLEAIRLGIVPAVSRVTVAPPGTLAAVPGARLRRAVAHALGLAAAGVFRRAGVWVNDYFVGMLGRAGLARPCPWAPYLRRLPPEGRGECVVHPGLLDETLRRRDPYVDERARELAALTGPGFAEAVSTFGIALTTKAALQREAAGRA